MGSIFSGSSGESNIVTLNDTNTLSESEIMGDNSGLRDNDENIEEYYDSVEDYQDARNKRKEEQLNEFNKQLNVKREQRRNILDRHRAEKKKLEETLIEERKSKLDLIKQNRILQELIQKNNIEIPETCQPSTEYVEFLQIIDKMHEEVDILKANNTNLRFDLASSNKALQEANADIADLSAQNIESMKQINALKEVISVTKTMISLRENQLLELKKKLNEIEQSLADREANMLSTDLRQEYERQLHNIRTLRGLYEERARLAEVTKQALIRDLDEQKLLLQAEVKKNEDLNNKVQELENKVNKLDDTVNDKNNEIASCKEECRGLQSEMSAVNKLFSQVLLGYKSKKDLDKLVTRLEENHGILTHMVEKENSSEVSSALPKMLLELVGQIEDNENNTTEKCQDTNLNVNEENISTETESTVSKAEEIVQNLPKVWRVLMELLSHQSEAETNSSEKVTTCYKPVQTKSGTVLVPSVSQTYIRLKDLILEKLALIKEVNRMKQLNNHLASRLHDQEKRLCSVTNELGKTWHVVGRLRKHHQQLHTHEKILKYELQQKRKLLNELKQELEYCREKWEQAREKNIQTEKDWKKLRVEFSNRKLDSTSFNNSAESGYSDERPSDESSESNDESEPKLKYKKKIKKTFDSSTDLNLAAERDDPVSDMLDVADLSLDTQDDNLETFDQSDSCNSENILKSDRIVETEDECADISHDTLQETSLSKKYEDGEPPINAKSILKKIANPITNDYNNASSSKTISHNELKSAILNNESQNEISSEMNNNRITLINRSQSVPKLSDIINKKLDNINNGAPDENQEKKTLVCFSPENSQTVNTESSTETTADAANNKTNTSKLLVSKSHIEPPLEKHTIIEVDFKAILENVKQQDERLQQKEKRLQNLEQACSNVVSDLSSTLLAGDSMISKLDTLNSERNRGQEVAVGYSISKLDTPNSELNNEEKIDDLNELQDRDNIENEPSTSSEVDHEARFAARDIRLKRLEEQTKSLVNKVNKTATKGVKIHYKLEELHNIYGSDNSRSGTPSDDTEDLSQKTDVTSQEE